MDRQLSAVSRSGAHFKAWKPQHVWPVLIRLGVCKANTPGKLRSVQHADGHMADRFGKRHRVSHRQTFDTAPAMRNAFRGIQGKPLVCTPVADKATFLGQC